MITDLPINVFKRYRGDKHFSEFYLQDGGKNQLASIWNCHCHPTSLSLYVYQSKACYAETCSLFISRDHMTIKALNVAYGKLATHSVTSGRSQFWKLKFSSTAF